MNNIIHYSPEALNDLDDIWNYITSELCNPSAAEKTIDGIIGAISNLCQFPETGTVLRFADGINSGYRFVQYEKYMAFYRIKSTNVFIDRVIYAKRDYMKILFEIEE